MRFLFNILFLIALGSLFSELNAGPDRSPSGDVSSGSFSQREVDTHRSRDAGEESSEAIKRIRRAAPGRRVEGASNDRRETPGPVRERREGSTVVIPQRDWMTDFRPKPLLRRDRPSDEESDAQSSSELISSLRNFVNEHGEPSDRELLYVVVADGHGFLDDRRKVLQQAVEMKDYLGFKKIILIDLGDRSNGSNPDEVKEMDQLAREFGIEVEDHWGIPGNMEYRGQGELTIVHEREWREKILREMQNNTSLMMVTDKKGNQRPVRDDEMVELPLFPEDPVMDSNGDPMIVMAGHKPETLLPSGSKPDEQLVQRAPLFLFPLKAVGLPFVWRLLPVPNPLAHSDIPYTINYRNWLGVPVVAVTVTAPSWFLGVPLSPFINFRLNPKALVPDLWRPFGATLQLAWDIMRLKPLKRDRNYRLPRWSSWFRKSGTWVEEDERSLSQKVRDRLLSIPRIDPETAVTMRRETPVPDGTAVVLSGHTHRPGVVRKLMRTEDGHFVEVLVVEVPPSFDDPHVEFGASGWVSLVKDERGNLRVLMHDKNKGGAIVFDESAEAPTRRGAEAKVDSRFGRAHVFDCKRMMSEVGASANFADKFRKFGKALSPP